MASIEARKTKNGRHTRYRVKWRTGGTGAGEWDGETFDTHSEARRFKGLVDGHGDRRPPAEQLLAHGFDQGLAYRVGDRVRGVIVPNSGKPLLVPSDVPTAGAEPDVPTFMEYAEQYIENLDHALGYTRRRYRGWLRNHVQPHFGDMPINEIEYEHIRKWQRQMVAKGLSRATIANIRGTVIIPVFKAACKPQAGGRQPALCQGNPADGLRLPAGRKKRRDVITSERDIKLYMQCAYEIDPEAGDLLMVAITTGLRWGDLAGLRCRDIDLEEAEIRPSQVLARGSDDHDRWELREYTKSIAGDERVIPIPPGIVALLRRRLAARGPDSLVFTAPMGGAWDHSRFRERRYLPILELAQQRGLGRHITPHALRHSLLTMLADAGTDPKVMQHIAGHESMATLYNNYVRPTKDQRKKAAATVARVVPMNFPAAS